MTLKLTRFAETPDGVLGRLGPFYTLEEENLRNRPNVSCIPAGVYRCVRTRYHAGGYDTYEVTGVPGRSRILIHAGNTEEDTEGCILVGMRLGVLTVRDEDGGGMRPKLAVLDSRRALEALMARLAGVPEFTLVIEEYRG